jgi:hypothetical protein
MAAAGMAAVGAAVGAVVAGVTTVADLPPAPFSAECWPRLITIRSHIIIRLPVITKVTRRMARLTTACGGSGHTIPVAAPISATTVTDILVHECTKSCPASLNNRCTLSRRKTKRALPAVKVFFFMIAFTFILPGCVRDPWGADTDPEIVACQSTYGFTPGTRDYDQCIQKFKEIDSRKTNRSIL